MRRWIGSMLFTTLMVLSVVFYGLFALLMRLFGYPTMYRAVIVWSRMMLALLRWLCGLDFEVSGREHLPAGTAVVLMKHASSWETIAQTLIFPRQTWVLKRELMWAPILGWALMCLKPIAINRKGGKAAVSQVLKQGSERLREGLWVVVFPEGTRVPFGQSGRFGLSGTLLAQQSGRPIVPVAHNAGWYWPRRSLWKKPGTIRVVIGEPIDTAGRDAREINTEVQNWIETQMRALGPAIDTA
jgi:1-acyl-sn-glycerol-3-phosphate acyltransferase